MKVRIPLDIADFYYYPDAFADCSGGGGKSHCREEPRVVFEVLSESTERTDRHEKQINYRRFPSLMVSVLVDQSRPMVTVYRRDGAGWKEEIISGLKGVLELPEIGCRLPLSEIYERVAFA